MMSILNSIRNQATWSLRRINLKLPKKALVLEVGSGGNPYPRSNVLLDAYEETRERHWDPLVHDRPTVLSLGENLPFKDKAFDYVIAAHVLEHTPYPEQFLAELQRVAQAGYIETPDAFMERINPYKDHRLEVTVRNDALVIRKKPGWIYDADLVELYEQRAKAIITHETIPNNAAAFHIRYCWRDTINYRIVNPEVNASWEPPVSCPALPPSGSRSQLNAGLLKIIRQVFSQHGRNARLDILPLLRCPQCHGESVSRAFSTALVCTGCGANYSVNGNLYQFRQS